LWGINHRSSNEAYRYNGNVYLLPCLTLRVQKNRPTLESLIAFYTDSVSAKYWIEEFFKPVAEVRREKIFKPRAQYVNEIYKGRSGALFGDIGAGFGIFLEELEKTNSDYRLVAIEPSKEQFAICISKGFNTISSALEEVTGYDNQFDFMAAYELFEHLFDPQLFLQHVFRLLKPGAFFFMSTLNGQGFDIQLLWDKSKNISPPSHLNFFNPDSINNLFNRCGFEIQEIAIPGKLDWDIVEGMVKYEGVVLQRFFHMLAEKASERCKEDLQEWIA